MAAINKEKKAILVVFLSFLLATLVSSDRAFMSYLCGRVRHTPLCLSILLGDDRSTECGYESCAALMAIEGSATIARGDADFMSNNTSPMPPVLKATFEFCGGKYEESWSVLDQAMMDFAEGRLDLVLAALEGSKVNAEDCEAGFHVSPTPLSYLNGRFENVTELTSDLVRLVMDS